MLIEVEIILSTVLAYLALRKIWNSLKLNPGLQRNERIMILHITMLLLFVISSFVMIVSNFIMTAYPHMLSFKAVYALSASFEGLTNTIAMLIILYFCFRFTKITQKTHNRMTKSFMSSVNSESSLDLLAED